jgi:hypothetical protein
MEQNKGNPSIDPQILMELVRVRMPFGQQKRFSSRKYWYAIVCSL